MTDCEHGQLARSCEICELKKEVEKLKGEVGWLTFRLADNQADIETLLAELKQAKAELAKFVECDESDMEQSTKFWWDCTRKIYHKE